MKARFGMRKRVLSSREPYGTMHEVRRGPSCHLLQSGNPESPFDVGVGETERGKPRGIGQGMGDLSSRHFSVIEGLDSSEKCWMGALEFVVRLRVLASGFSSTASRTSNFSTVWGELCLKYASPPLNQANQRLAVPMKVESSPSTPLMFRAVTIAPVPQSHS